MIKELKDTAIIKDEALIYDFMLEDIRVLNETYPELARELAISILEFIFTGSISSDDYWIKGKIS